MTLKLMLALVMAFIVAVIVGRFYIPWLRRMKAGQEIRQDGPTWHMSKAGTPTMGGVVFITGCTFVCLTVGFESMRQGDYTHIFVLLFALVFGAIGFLDDWEKLRKKQNLGLSAKAKFLLSSLRRWPSFCCSESSDIYRRIFISRSGTPRSISPRRCTSYLPPS